MRREVNGCALGDEREGRGTERRGMDGSTMKRKRGGSKRRSGKARTTAIELQRALQLDLLLHVRGLGIRLLGGIEPVDVRLVVLGMVQSHDLLGDVRFESLLSCMVSMVSKTMSLYRRMRKRRDEHCKDMAGREGYGWRTRQQGQRTNGQRQKDEQGCEQETASCMLCFD